MVGRVGIEPTETEANGVTDRPNSPTLAPAHINDFKVSQPRIHLASHICSRRSSAISSLLGMERKAGFEPTIVEY